LRKSNKVADVVGMVLSSLVGMTIGSGAVIAAL
jgi:hypothetical protein